MSRLRGRSHLDKSDPMGTGRLAVLRLDHRSYIECQRYPDRRRFDREERAITKWCALLTVTALLTIGSPATAVVYEVIDLGTLGGTNCDGIPGRSSYAVAVNGRGQVAGFSCAFVPPLSTPTTHAFLWSVGVMRDIGTLGIDPLPHHSYATEINDAGHVVGFDRGRDPSAPLSGGREGR